jgi:hypothetical protein
MTSATACQHRASAAASDIAGLVPVAFCLGARIEPQRAGIPLGGKLAQQAHIGVLNPLGCKLSALLPGKVGCAVGFPHLHNPHACSQGMGLGGSTTQYLLIKEVVQGPPAWATGAGATRACPGQEAGSATCSSPNAGSCRMLDHAECWIIPNAGSYRMLDHAECWIMPNAGSYRMLDHAECWTMPNAGSCLRRLPVGNATVPMTVTLGSQSRWQHPARPSLPLVEFWRGADPASPHEVANRLPLFYPALTKHLVLLHQLGQPLVAIVSHGILRHKVIELHVSPGRGQVSAFSTSRKLSKDYLRSGSTLRRAIKAFLPCLFLAVSD